MSRKHGYGTYSHGCRCDECRAAKATYMRTKRRAASAKQKARKRLGAFVAPLTAHGISGYQNHACRCPTCVEAHRQVQRRQYRQNRGALAAAEAPDA